MTKKILIIDDEENFTKIVKLNLEAKGQYQVIAEHNPFRTLAVAKEFRPDLILLDVIMPGMSGGDVAFRIKQDVSLKNTPIVFLTAAATKEDTTSREGTIGGHPFLSKPVSVKDLIACIEENIRKKSS